MDGHGPVHGRGVRDGHRPRGPRRRSTSSREDPRLRDRYGRTRVGQACLLARRLVEAGVTFVTVVDGGWDHHGQVFASCRRQLPPLDAAVADAWSRTCTTAGWPSACWCVVWGEFGRTPRINGTGGRDHWPGCMSALLAGGGLRMGQVVGATEPQGRGARRTRLASRGRAPYSLSRARHRPPPRIPQRSGRPLAVLNQGRPIAELLASGA